MTKIREGLYVCDFCDTEINKTVQKVAGAGKKGRGSDVVKCKCGANVSQLTRLDRKLRIEKGYKV